MMFSYHSSPAFSFSRRYKPPKRQQRPAPTSYFSQDKFSKTTPHWKIGTSNRGKLTLKQQHNPGPGTYDNINNNNSGIKFTKANHKKQIDNEVPGPGTYTLNPGKKLKRGYYMSQKQKDLSNKNNPGPGWYDGLCTNTTLKKEFGKMGNAIRLVYKNSQTPGPGTYLQRCQSAGTRMSFSKQKKLKLKIHNNNIGPGKYEIESGINSTKNKGYKMNGRYSEVQKQQTPGPSTYKPKDITKPSNRSVLIAQRFLTQKRPNTPGPGQYSFENRSSFISDVKHGALGKQNRKSFITQTDTPGPAAYSFHMKPNCPSSPKYTLQGGRDIICQTEVPGVGEYSPSYQYTKIRPFSAKIGSSIRKQQKRQTRPGPGQYNHKGLPDGPSWGFGSQLKNSTICSQTPGPNYYHLKSTISDVPSYLLTQTC